MTFHTTYRSPKFFICVHVTHNNEIQFESAVNRHTFYTYVTHGKGIYCCFDGKNAETFEFLEEKKLFDGIACKLRCRSHLLLFFVRGGHLCGHSVSKN